MAEPWWKTGPQDVQRINERISSLYVERRHIDRDNNAIVLVNKKETIHLPAAALAVLMAGPGTRITHAAAALLGDSGTTICWVGEKGVRMYGASSGLNTGSHLIMKQAWLSSRPKERTAVARKMYAKRFPGEDITGNTIQQLMGKEGTRMKRLYAAHAKRTGVEWSGRKYVAGNAYAAGDDVNRLISAGNAALYGICHAVITAIGASPALGFVHTGLKKSFILDIADLYKADITIPPAFDLAAAGRTKERDIRIAIRDNIGKEKLLSRIVDDIKTLLVPEGTYDDTDTNNLWSGNSATVAGGQNWGDSNPFDDGHLDIMDIDTEPNDPTDDYPTNNTEGGTSSLS